MGSTARQSGAPLRVESRRGHRDATTRKVPRFCLRKHWGILRNYAISRRAGYVCTNDAGVIVGRDPDSVRGPDITFYEDDQTAEDMERQYAAVPPMLAVEVVSPSDRINEVMLRVRQLLDRGVKVVWVVDPEARDVSICEVGQQPQLVSGDQPIEGGQYLVNFRCLASEFFTLPGR